MNFLRLDISLDRLKSPMPIWMGNTRPEQWQEAARQVAAAGGRLVSLWGSDRRGEPGGPFVVSAAYAVHEGLICLGLDVPEGTPSYPDISAIFPSAARMQRAIADLLGVTAVGAVDTRAWLKHGAWADGWFPLRHDAAVQDFGSCVVENYPFVPVTGDGVHEIPVGPVHAGIIEPGHFRFSVVGEKLLRLEARLGYTHRGIDRLFSGMHALEGHLLAGRVSGDANVAFSWAYCMALEAAWGSEVPDRARWLRALFLERERVANHLGDLGALGNDAAFAFGLAQFSRLKEDLLRLNKTLFGHRYLMDRVVPGGVACDLSPEGERALLEQCASMESEVRSLKNIYDEHAGLQDRFVTTGRVTPHLAAQLGLTGLAGRASGQANDLRADHPMAPYDSLGPEMATHRSGDVAARVIVRFEETLESLRLIRGMIDGLPKGEWLIKPLAKEDGSFGMGWTEGWRGEVLVALELTDDGRLISRCHCHDPSWHNWPVLEHAVIGNIVPDFPLINKSFNLSYAGHDR